MGGMTIVMKPNSGVFRVSCCEKVVPVLRNTEQMSVADIEGSIGNFGRQARDVCLFFDEDDIPRPWQGDGENGWRG